LKIVHVTLLRAQDICGSSVKLPAGWKAATSLEVAAQEGSTVRCQPVTKAAHAASRPLRGRPFGTAGTHRKRSWTVKTPAERLSQWSRESKRL